MSESHEARQLEIFGNKLFFETNAVAPDGPGKVAYLMSSQTSDHVKYNQSLHEGSGMSRINADKVLQIESGVKCDTNEKSLPIILSAIILFIFSTALVTPFPLYLDLSWSRSSKAS